VAVHSYEHEDLNTIEDVSKTLLDQVEAFFVSYNQQRDKKFSITGTGGPKKALKFLKGGMGQFEDKSPSKKKANK
jgi:inorganic pyrophosphatase